jgi:hypothetical protein
VIAEVGANQIQGLGARGVFSDDAIRRAYAGVSPRKTISEWIFALENTKLLDRYGVNILK